MPTNARELKIFAGSSNRPLAENICAYLGVPLGASLVKSFSDGETWVELGENARGRDAYVIQSTSFPANEHLMQLLVLIDALKRASAYSITAVIPYYGYGRQDRKVAPRTPITAKLIADLLTAAGADRIVSMDLHAGQIQGFFDIPFDHLYGAPVLLKYIESLGADDLVVVSPDAGGVERARAYAKRLNASLAIVDKRRERANVSQAMNVIGDVQGKTAVIVDDIADTAGSLTQSASVLMERGATSVYAAITHPVLSGPALERIQESKIKGIAVTDTIPLQEATRNCEKISVLSVASILGEAIRRIHSEDSVTSLFI